MIPLYFTALSVGVWACQIEFQFLLRFFDHFIASIHNFHKFIIFKNSNFLRDLTPKTQKLQLSKVFLTEVPIFKQKFEFRVSTARYLQQFSHLRTSASNFCI